MEFKTKTIQKLINEHFIGKLIEFYEWDETTMSNNKGRINEENKIHYDIDVAFDDDSIFNEKEKEKLLNGEQIIYTDEDNNKEEDFYYKRTYKCIRLIDKIISIKKNRNLWIATTNKGYNIKFSEEDSFKLILNM